MPTWTLDAGGLKYLYYIGWTVRNTIPYHNAIGLAISDDGGKNYRRHALGPLFGNTMHEPYFTGNICVMIDGGVWRAWYMCCTGWSVLAGRPEPRYHIRYAESGDGFEWRRDGRIAIDYKSEPEAGISRPCVLRRSGGGYEMWYSYRNGLGYRTDPACSYRIGYATSSDGIEWQRQDELAGIDVSDHGWDSQMIEYPQVVRYGARELLFYNGNGFGGTGIGYAESVTAPASV